MRENLKAARKAAAQKWDDISYKIAVWLDNNWLFNHTIGVFLDVNWDGPKSWQGKLILLLVQIGLVVWLTPIFYRWLSPLLTK